jgi:predicted membrane GTPase involved in stress response
MMRREGYEMSVGKPSIVTKEVDGAIQSPRNSSSSTVPRGSSAW